MDTPPGLKSPGRPFVVKIGDAVAPMMNEHNPSLMDLAAQAVATVAGAAGEASQAAADAIDGVAGAVDHAISAPQGAEDAGAVGEELKAPYVPPQG